MSPVLALLYMKVEPDTVLGVALAPPPPPLSPLSMAPPSTLAVLSINVELEMAKAPLLLYSSPVSMAPRWRSRRRRWY